MKVLREWRAFPEACGNRGQRSFDVCIITYYSCSRLLLLMCAVVLAGK